eukprot:TRINITY_DN9759_c0_g1_i1.p1 TRINITY_DN9759_c0_g1~~TRINITY_DN9759_c0_g1_i1.p1  ORF type:complete len:829 (-),score=148.58 TRINITY_DN9759_c0_g1_i1:26-2461(-)
MAAEIIPVFKSMDRGTGEVPREDLKRILGTLLKCPDKELDGMLSGSWGTDMVKYEDFIMWLFGESGFKSGGSSWKIALFSCAPYDKDWFGKIKKELGFDFQLCCIEESLTLSTAKLAAGCNAVCLFVNDPCDEAVIRELAGLGIKMIALRCAGFDRVHLETAEACGITVARVPAYSPHAVAEFAITLMITANRKIPQAALKTRRGDFTLNGLMGSDMNGKRVGVIGTGLIGSIAARILKRGFECEVVAYDVFQNPKIKDPPPAGLDIPYVSLDELFATCDFITLHAPLLPSTMHTINKEAVNKMKKGVIIVNTSRGGLIDTEALVDGLKCGIIGGVGLDVVENEGPFFFKDCSSTCITDKNIVRLMRMPNVILTGHQAFFTQEAMKTIAQTTLNNVDGVQKGTGPPKQMGKLETLCKPAAPGGGGPRPPGATSNMAIMRELPAVVNEIKLKDLPPVTNSASGAYKVAVFSTAPYDQESLQGMNTELGTGLSFSFFGAGLGPDTVPLAAGHDAVCIFVNDDCSASVVRGLKDIGVKMIALRCAGFNNVDLDLAQELGIKVARVPAYSPHAVAEHAVTLAMGTNRKIVSAFEATRKGNFNLDGMLGFDMVGKRVGIIGTGLIGSLAARIYKNGFDCDVVAYDAFKSDKISAAPPEGLGIPYVELDELLNTADVISLHVPLLKATANLINEESIRKMKKGVLLINTSRGGLVDTKALIRGLEEGIIGGAGLDVLEGESEYFFNDWSNKPLLHDDLANLLSFQNAVVTAHQAFFTREAMETIAHTTIANINGVRNTGEPPKQRGKYDTVCLPAQK